MAGREKYLWGVLGVLALVGLFSAGRFGCIQYNRYMDTPRVVQRWPSPDGNYTCVVWQSPRDEHNFGCNYTVHFQDKQGHDLVGGVLHMTDCIARIEWDGDAYMFWNLSSPFGRGFCINRRRVSESELSSDSALAQVEQWKTLQGLDLAGPAVTDAGLNHLRGCSNLRWLVLDNTKVTREGIDTLRRSLPDLTVYYRLPATAQVVIGPTTRP